MTTRLLASGNLAGGGAGILAILLLAAESLSSQPVTRLLSENQPGIYSPVLHYVILPEQQSSLRVVQQLPREHFRLKEYGRYFPSHGMENEIWLHTRIENGIADRDWKLVFDNPLIDEINVYVIRDGVPDPVVSLGERWKVSERPEPTRPLVVPILLDSGRNCELYINIDMDGRQTNPVVLVMSDTYFNVWESGERSELYLVYVSMALLAIFTFYLAVLFRDRVLGWLAVFYMSSLVVHLCTGGFASLYLWPESPGINSKLPGIMVFLSFFFAVGFARSFLAEAVSRLWIDRLLLGYMGVLVVLATIELLGGIFVYVTSWIMYRAIAFTFVLIFLVLIYALVKRQPSALLFFTGISILIVALLSLETPNEQSGHLFNNRLYLYTSAGGYLFMAFAAIDRMHKWKDTEKETQIIRERERIARDLHDNIGSRLTILSRSLRLAGMGEKISGSEWAQALYYDANETLAELRDTLWVLTKDEITVDQLRDKIENLCHRLKRDKSDINFRLEADTRPLDYQLSPDRAINLFRITQEAVNNCLKHSRAKHVVVYLEIASGILKLSIEDDGRGFDMQQHNRHQGYGTSNMSRRAHQIRAQLLIDSAEQQGTRIQVLLPL